MTRSLAPSDYHEPMPTGPLPDPMPTDPAPADPAPTDPAPAAITINIVGAFGPAAFAPNPLQAAVGHTVVWKNDDATVHQIVLEDGTNVGTIAPGQSSAPITLSAPAVAYRCTLHPSMVGTIQDPTVAAPAPSPTPAPTPEPPPDYGPPPDDGYGGYY